MTEPKTQQRSLKEEAGVALVLSVLFISSVGLILVAYINDVYQFKTARAEADAIAIQLCSVGSRDQPSVPLALSRMAAALPHHTPESSSRVIERVRFVAPGIQATPSGGAPDPLIDVDTPLGTLLPGLTCPNCFFNNDVESASVNDRYPASLWNRDTYGTFIGCEVEMRVNSIVLDNSELVLGKATFDLRDPRDNIGAGVSDGVIMGIAPQLVVSDTEPGVPGDSRYVFSDPLLDEMDPLRTSSGIVVNDGFSANKSTEAIPGHPSGLLVSGHLSVTDLVDRRNSLLSCNNPYLQVRKSLSSSLMERFARVNWTRTNTRLAVLNPQNSDGVANPPTVVVEKGQDLMGSSFGLPFMNYRPLWGAASGKRKTTNSNDYLCPFLGCTFVGPGDPSAEAAHQMLVASQLRTCFHTNYANATEQGVRRLGDAMMQFDPAIEPAALDAVDYLSSYSGGGNWTASSTELMNAVELTSLIGSFEQCPVSNKPGPTPSDPTTPCPKPDLFAPSDPGADAPGLRPDILAFLRYARGLTGAAAYASPGNLWTDLSSPSLIPQSALTVPASERPHVLLFLSKRISDAEKTQIRQFVLSELVPNEIPITVIFLATSISDMSNAIRDRLHNAFFTPEETETAGAGTPRNKVYIFGRRGFACAANETLCYRNFWEGLLDPQNEPSVWDIADTIYRERFAVSKLVL